MNAHGRVGQGTMTKRWDGLRVAGRRDFPGVARSAGAARKWVVELLCGQMAAETLETAELLVSEVVTNAILHSDSGGSGGLIMVRVGLSGDLVHIEVVDDGSVTSVPAIRTTDDDSLSGRGLSWVDRLAVIWGADRDDEAGGVVWFRLPRDGSATF
ncbi:ATP-binding protein [Streptosporangium sp. NPDC023963]|uniref:ATP-binding protein n=1 Tax=Streptosporangium sp. NPDC023963 TaxID=3155608 RepID=UPI003446512C